MTATPRILILQNLSGDSPAYLGTWLAAQGAWVDVRNSQTGETFPASLAGYDGLVLLGGAMSANDPLPPLRQAEALFLEAVREGVPTLGHCLGGQLMARALGARVHRSPAPEIGWQPARLAEHAAARAWFGDDAPREVVVFQWHYDAFDLPPGAIALASSAACPHQAFTWGGPAGEGAAGRHLAMQFHIEVDDAKVWRWSADGGPGFDMARRRYPGTVMDPQAMRIGAATHGPAHRALADHIYGRWWMEVGRRRA